MNKDLEYLEFYIKSNGNLDLINKFIKKENISLNEFNDIVTTLLKNLDNSSKNNGKTNKLYLEYCLKYGNKKNFDSNKISKRKETETIINIINNYIKEDRHNIKEYVSNNNITYEKFKKFINNYKTYYLTSVEKDILKKFLQRENEFNKENIKKVCEVVDKISEDLVRDKPFDILDYYKELGWDLNLLIYYMNNNKETFSNFLVDNVRLYFKKYGITEKKYKLNEFIDYIKKNDKSINNKEIENIINYMNINKMPYNYNLYKSIKKKYLVNKTKNLHPLY